jgi:hypothetical protein
VAFECHCDSGRGSEGDNLLSGSAVHVQVYSHIGEYRRQRQIAHLNDMVGIGRFDALDKVRFDLRDERHLLILLNMLERFLYDL